MQSLRRLHPEPSCISAGLNATNATMHHLPFAEASLSHKHRKRMGSGAELEDGAATDYSAAAAEGDLFVQKPPASAEQVGCKPIAGSGGMHQDRRWPQACHEMVRLQNRPLGRQVRMVSMLGLAVRQAAPTCGTHV